MSISRHIDRTQTRILFNKTLCYHDDNLISRLINTISTALASIVSLNAGWDRLVHTLKSLQFHMIKCYLLSKV